MTWRRFFANYSGNPDSWTDEDEILYSDSLRWDASLETLGDLGQGDQNGREKRTFKLLLLQIFYQCFTIILLLYHYHRYLYHHFIIIIWCNVPTVFTCIVGDRIQMTVYNYNYNFYLGYNASEMHFSVLMFHCDIKRCVEVGKLVMFGMEPRFRSCPL